jgi:hypothetical protein
VEEVILQETQDKLKKTNIKHCWHRLRNSKSPDVAAKDPLHVIAQGIGIEDWLGALLLQATSTDLNPMTDLALSENHPKIQWISVDHHFHWLHWPSKTGLNKSPNGGDRRTSLTHGSPK